MSLEQILPFLMIVALGTYVQTVTGFGMGMVILGFVAQLDLYSITFTSVVVSILMLANGPIALHGNLKAIDRKPLCLTLAGLFPALIVGVLLLNYLSDEFARILQLILGVTIICGGMFIVLKPEPLPTPSGSFSFVAAGSVAGLFGGLFAISGPPLVYQYYRQPFPLHAIRMSLLMLLLLMDFARLIVMETQGSLDLDMLWVSLICIPVVAIFTLAGRRYPPPFSDKTMRRLAFCMLIVIGVSLTVGAVV